MTRLCSRYVSALTDRDPADPLRECTRLRSHRDGIDTVNAGVDATRCDIPRHVGTHPTGILVGIFVARRVKNCQHLNRLRHADEKRDYRPETPMTLSWTPPVAFSRGYTDFVHDYTRTLLSSARP